MNANEGFEEFMQFDKVCKLLLLKISRDAQYPVPLSNICEYESGVKVPPEKRKAVLAALHGEIRARELMGDEAYFESVPIMAKITLYEAALDALASDCLRQCVPDATISWAEFKQQVATQLLICQREERQAIEQAQKGGVDA